MSTTDRSIFQQLYDAEINFEVSCFWDDGFHVRLGDRITASAPRPTSPPGKRLSLIHI